MKQKIIENTLTLYRTNFTEVIFEKYPKKIWGIDTKKMTPDWAPNRIKFRKKILPFYHEEFAAVGKYGTGCIYDH